MWFGYYPQIIFAEVNHYSGVLTIKANMYICSWYPVLCAAPPTVLRRFFSNLYICSGHGVRVWMWFVYNP